jgi:hypothetical protein
LLIHVFSNDATEVRLLNIECIEQFDVTSLR